MKADADMAATLGLVSRASWQTPLPRSKKLNAKSWNQETVDRYVKVAQKLNSLPKASKAIDLLEAHMGRESCLDGITALRALASVLVADSFVRIPTH